VFTFQISPDKVAVISHGINNRIPRRDVSQKEAREKLNIELTAHAILFFGQVDEYKGIETLIDAASLLVKENPAVVLIIAGKPKRHLHYAVQLKSKAEKMLPENNVLFRLQFVPVDEVELYFAAQIVSFCHIEEFIRAGLYFLHTDLACRLSQRMSAAFTRI